MNFLNATQKITADFAREEDGAQIVEYGMIIGAVSLVLIGLLAALGTSNNSAFATMVGKVKNCLTNTAC
jgi:pilus assembly protein Flp/PilA